MSNLKLRGILVLSGLSSMAGASHAAQPPDTVTSDSFGNTAMGGNALLSLPTPSPCTAAPWAGCYNNAAGYFALSANTTGHMNSAFGSYALQLNTTGYYNTATGSFALFSNSSGYYNTAVGSGSLGHNTTGDSNSASGAYALWKNTIGSANTATGSYALGKNTVGNNNTGSGALALYNNTTGSNNVANGAETLHSNSTGGNNTAAGYWALHANTTGSNNNAAGVEALFSNTTADDNNAMGHAALFTNTTGVRNSAVGTEALYHNTTGSYNDAVGYLALNFNSTGNYNVGIGYEAGYFLTSGSNNIDIGSFGAAADSGTIRIGQPGTHTATYVTGIVSTQITGSAVYVTASGQLGVLASSERYKTAVAPLGPNTEKLQQLRPVSFHLKSEPNGAVQYGLIAEEVDKIYPELVIRDEAGKIQGVRYDELTPMLLTQVQQQQRRLEAQAEQLRDLQRKMAELLVQLHSGDRIVAQR